MRGELFQEILISAQYRLLALEAEESHRNPPLVDSMVEMGMLAFSTVTFLQIEGLPIHTEDFATKLRQLLNSLASSGSSHPALKENEPDQAALLPGETEVFLKLKLWLFFMGYNSVLDQPKHQQFVSFGVSETMGALGLSTWTAVRDVLMAHMWVDWTHKTKGKALVESILVNQVKSQRYE